MRDSVQHEDNVVYSTIVSLLRMRAEQQPGRIGYTYVTGAEAVEITYAELDRRAAAIGCMLSDLGMRGQLVMLVYPPGLDYIAAFFGCLYAGAIAVPACPPDLIWRDRALSHLAAVVRDAKPSLVLTTTATSAILGSLSSSSSHLARLRIMATDDVPAGLAGAWEPAPVPAGSVALLQYTSGSTSAPKGVILTHRNLMSNSALISRFFGHSEESRGVTWLPGHHDMGLIGGIVQPLYAGFPVTMLAPADFLREPLRWLQEISRTRATTSGGPNFAYDLCVRKTTREERSQLDLSSWRVAFNGAEPIRAETMENFARAFEPAGFRREAFHPCYGLAEATLIVTGGLTWSRPGVKSFDEASLRYGTAIPSASPARSRRLVSCGFSAGDRQLVIVDPVSRVERAAGQVGEIWIAGHGVAPGYWHRAGETAEVFGATLAGTGEGPFMRSGDLGFVLGRQLFVTGRMKDLIIIRGRNHHPQDIELAAERSRPVLRPGCAAAFTVAPGGQQRLVVALEVTWQAASVNVGEVADAIRAAVAAAHAVQVHTVVLLPPGTIPKTSSGKVQRGLCAAMFTAGQLTELGRSTIGRVKESPSRLDRSGLLAAPAGKRRDLLRAYLCGLVASACGTAADQAADAPLLALGIDSCAVVSIQQSIETDLGAHLTVSDLAHAASVTHLAARLDDQLRAKAAPAPAPGSGPAPVPAPGSGSAPRSGPTAEDAPRGRDAVRLYAWVGGSRVPVQL